MKKRVPSCLIGITAVIMSLWLAGCYVRIGGSSKERFERELELSAPLESGGKLVAKTSFGSIVVRGSDTDQCRVSAKICANAPTQAEAEEIAQKTKILLKRVNDGLSISVDKPRLSRNRNIGVSLTIQVPKSTELDCKSSFASIDIEHINADIKADTSFASITLNDVKGVLDLSTSHGSIKGRQLIPADTHAKTSFANINLDFRESETDNTMGVVHVETSHGSIKLRRLAAERVSAKSSFGSIDITCSDACTPDVDAKVNTSHGGVTFKSPPEFSGSVTMSTSHGSLHTDLPISVQGETGKHKLAGQIGDGSGKLQLRTRFGSIKLR
jgi:DUF4097 and DUF4098 domain-containing protein YvlB